MNNSRQAALERLKNLRAQQKPAAAKSRSATPPVGGVGAGGAGSSTSTGRVLVPNSSSPVQPSAPLPPSAPSRRYDAGEAIPISAAERKRQQEKNTIKSQYFQMQAAPFASSASAGMRSSDSGGEPPRKKLNTGGDGGGSGSSSVSSTSTRFVPVGLDPVTNKIIDLDVPGSNSSSDDGGLDVSGIRLQSGPGSRAQTPKSTTTSAMNSPDPLSLTPLASTTSSSVVTGVPGKLPNTTESIARLSNLYPSLSKQVIVMKMHENDFDATRVSGALHAVAQHDEKLRDAAAAAAAPPPVKKQSAIYANRRSLGDGLGGADGQGAVGKERKKKSRHADSGSDSGGEDDYGGGGRSKGMSRIGLERDEEKDEREAVEWFNTCTEQALLDITSCNAEQAKAIVAARPFEDADDLRAKLQKKRGVSTKLFDDYLDVIEGYYQVDRVLEECEAVGDRLARAMTAFQMKKAAEITAAPPFEAKTENGSAATVSAQTTTEEPAVVEKKEEGGTSTDRPAGEEQKKEELEPSTTAVDLVEFEVDDEDLDNQIMNEKDPERKFALKCFIRRQPKLLAEGVKLKDYQMLGLNWLYLLYKKQLSCILADEMGLGKTIQVIAFLAHLKEMDVEGPHLIIVPSSTLENWAREFERFAPEMDVQTYYGTQRERYDHGKALLASQPEVVLTTYAIASGTNRDDKKFLKRMEFITAVFDEGHQLKNYKSARYKALMAFDVEFRLLLTGTPLQNNLQELVSILNFILPSYFEESEEALRAIFKVGANSHANLLSKQRVSRAQKMMRPFVLRRRKDQVLKDLPKKFTRIEWCPMTDNQRALYHQQEATSRQSLKALADEAESKKQAKSTRRKRDRDDLEIDTGPAAKASGDNGSNVLMKLRKAASHPLLFRTLYDDQKIKKLAKDLMQEPEYMDKEYIYLVEDMQEMSDAELTLMCHNFKSLRKHILPKEAFVDCGKVLALKKLVLQCLESGTRMLLFSMFTQILDILKVVLTDMDIKWIVLTGTTKVDERQALVDEFTNDPSITVFLLSTLAGGMGINLTAANVVVVYDQGFNPHNEKQAADRAYRIGQTKDVEVITLLTENTIDEDIHDLALSKLRLDDAVAGRDQDGGDSKADAGDSEGSGGDKETEAAVKSSLLSKLRVKLEVKAGGEEPPAADGKKEMENTDGDAATMEVIKE